MSWSSSLLFVLQYGLYRHGHDRPFDHPALSKIFLLVVDTRDFLPGTFIRDQEAIEAFKDHSQDLARFHGFWTYTGYYFGEREHWNKWADRVVTLRYAFEEPQSAAHTERSDVRKAVTIAQGCFGDRWAPPVAAMLLSLKSRRRDDAAILEGFRSMFSGEAINTFQAMSAGLTSLS
nr:hypothetical protein LTR18_002323 [Exophiala xenobiotica]